MWRAQHVNLMLVLAHVEYVDEDVAGRGWIVGCGNSEFSLNADDAASLDRALMAHYKL